jgi:c-di-GMP phosphodiesterase Gmr
MSVAMHSPYKHDFQAAAIPAENESGPDSELNILRDVFRLLPAGVTVQDERGEFLLANDAGTALLQMTADAPAPSQDLS